MSVHSFDPFADSRWDKLVARHPAASVFHTRGWLEALHRTYGFAPQVVTTCQPGSELTNGIVLCAVRSWLTGRRLVSVPFADHCAPLLASSEDEVALLEGVSDAVGEDLKYAELRPLTPLGAAKPDLHPSAEFILHTVDLRDDLEDIRRRLHPSGIQRKIRRAERERVRHEQGRAPARLDDFYELFVQTRKRHGAPPPSKQWFANLIECFGDAATIRVAYKDGRPIGSIVTLRHRGTLVYKYGGSDAAFHNLGAMPFLFWRAIEDAKAAGLERLDLGRSDRTNAGLAQFKERLGGTASSITYYRLSRRPPRRSFRIPAPSPRLLARLPKPLLLTAGRLLYRHIA